MYIPFQQVARYKGFKIVVNSVLCLFEVPLLWHHAAATSILPSLIKGLPIQMQYIQYRHKDDVTR